MFVLLCWSGIAGFALLLHADRSVRLAAEGRVYTDAAAVPQRRVALVLGCAKRLSNGRLNLYFQYRMRAAAELYHAGRVDFILVSGDNHRHGVNEPEDMKADLIARGVPADRIVCDYAGFRTLDSVVRAKKVFQVDEAVVISQDWHARRAIYLARGHGLDLTAYAARDVGRRKGLRTKTREQLAKVKAVLDLHLLRTRPRFLGDPEPVGSASPSLAKT